jgi:hypothetical protein
MSTKIFIFDYVNTVCTIASSILNRHKVIKCFIGPVVPRQVFKVLRSSINGTANQ